MAKVIHSEVEYAGVLCEHCGKRTGIIKSSIMVCSNCKAVVGKATGKYCTYCGEKLEWGTNE